jgi:hypothetical protein
LKHQIYFFVVVILLHFYLRLHTIIFLFLHTILLLLWLRTKITVISSFVIANEEISLQMSNKNISCTNCNIPSLPVLLAL